MLEKLVILSKYIFNLFIYFLILCLLFLFYLVTIHPYFETTYDFYTYQKQHQNILEIGKIDSQKPKRLLSYRYRKTFGFDGISSCYVNFYQLPENFNTQAFLKNYQLTNKHNLRKQYENYGGSINLESCLNTTDNMGSFRTNAKPINKKLFFKL